MFIELTDHLRCPGPHAEAYLVLIPGTMQGRQVVEGMLGCPVCQAEYPIREGQVEFGTVEPPPAVPGPTPPEAAALHAFLGLEGPGGYVALVGEAAREARPLAALLPGVHLALVNPPAGTVSSTVAGVLHTPRFPLKQRSLRGAVVGAPWALVPGWNAAAVEAVLPGLRAAGEGEPPAVPGFELLGTAGGWWVGRR
ncbi:MAG: hypothetical protein SF070_13140 [Gemmatimonadota bacterium]|nr:hypothetical protein [Gemmatimonadota bacterium]